MNTPNNKKRKNSQEKIEKVFIELIQTKEIYEISITDICKKANINRTTFYSNYIDIYDLADKIKLKLLSDVYVVYSEEREKKSHSYDFLKLYNHIKENQIFYKTYFKLGINDNFDNYLLDKKEIKRFYGDEFDNDKELDYHITFFKAGLNAVLKKWLYNDCKESPEYIDKIIKDEYLKITRIDLDKIKKELQ